MSDSVTKNGIAWKPCPFCGGEAILRSNYNSYFGYGILCSAAFANQRAGFLIQGILIKRNLMN